MYYNSEQINPSKGLGWNQVDFGGINFLLSAIFITLEIFVGQSLKAILNFFEFTNFFRKFEWLIPEINSILIALILSFPVILFAMIYEVYQVEFIQTNLMVFLNSSLAIAVSFFVSLNVIKYFIIYINDIGFYPFMIYRIIAKFTILILVV